MKQVEIVFLKWNKAGIKILDGKTETEREVTLAKNSILLCMYV